MAKTINGAETQFLYDRLNPAQELNGANPPNVTANLLTGLGIDEYFTRTDAGGTMAFLADALGSTVGLVNAAGGIDTSYTYQPFGAATVNGTSANPYQFTGRENDGTGLYFYRARYYSPTFKRFIAQDPLDFRGDDANLYSYTKNQPTGYSDPMGEMSQWTIPLPIEVPINGPGSSPFDPQFPGPPGGALPPDTPGSTCPLPAPPPPPYCFPGSGVALTLANGLAAHETAEIVVEATIGVTIGPEVLITSLAFDLAFSAPIDLSHGYACGDF